MRVFAVLLLAAAGVFAAESDALAIQQRIEDRHLPYGMVLDPMYEWPNGQSIIGYSRCGDSAIWTGHYLAAQSYRYAVTKSPDALREVKYTIEAIRKLIAVTGTDVLARCAVPASSPWASGMLQEEQSHGSRFGSVDGQPWVWVGDTSRDQYLGVFFGLTVAYDVVPDNDVRGSVNYLATKMLDYLRGHGWTVTMPGGGISTTFLGRSDQQLMLLKLGRRTNPSRFSTAYKTMSTVAAPETMLPIAIEVTDPYSSYFKFNLDYITMYGLNTGGDNSWLKMNYGKAYDILRDATHLHQNAFFNMIDRAIDGPDAGRDAETRQLLDAWLKRPLRDVQVDLRQKYSACEQEDRSCTVIPVEERVTTDFLWQRSPFQLYGGGVGTIEPSGIDYILPYWMARYYGVL